MLKSDMETSKDLQALRQPKKPQTKIMVKKETVAEPKMSWETLTKLRHADEYFVVNQQHLLAEELKTRQR